MGDATERDPGLPIKLGPCSNTEFAPPPPSPVAKEAARRARTMAEERARKLGMPRRRFLLSSMGAATTLAALAACSRESSNANGNGNGSPGGTYNVSDEATIDMDAALAELGDDQPVIDVQTHFLELPTEGDPALAQGVAAAVSGFSAVAYNSDCAIDEDPLDCLSTERWIEEVFGRSDTTVAVISALPFGSGTPNDPLSASIMADGRRQLAELCEGEGDRVLVQGHGQPNGGDLDEFFEQMEAEAEQYNIVAWKSYTHVGGGWMLDDSLSGNDRLDEYEGLETPIGSRYLDKVQELYDAGVGPNVVAVHKGLSIISPSLQGTPYASPSDIGPAATNYPDIQFCVYHSGYEVGEPEGGFDPENPNAGVDRLILSMQDHDLGPNSNVYAELGGTWRNLMSLTDADTQAHVLGKLLLYVGEDRVLWGTDSIWFGSPQDQIEALRTFEISEQFQEQYGYPALTDEIKHKIFWRNAARLHTIDTYRLTCDAAADRSDPAGNEEARQSSRLDNRTYGPSDPTISRRLFIANHPWLFNRT